MYAFHKKDFQQSAPNMLTATLGLKLTRLLRKMSMRNC